MNPYKKMAYVYTKLIYVRRTQDQSYFETMWYIKALINFSIYLLGKNVYFN